MSPPPPFPVPIEFLLFALTLVAAALFHRRTVTVALVGLGVIAGYKLVFGSFASGPGLSGLVAHLEHEWVVLANLALLLTGFAILARQFEASGLPDAMPRVLPHSWVGALVLLAIVFTLSLFLDNIAGALIGGTVARHVFKDKVHLGYLAAIVGAANAGGAGSPIGDTTTTMMWVAGVGPGELVEAAIGGVVALLVFGIPLSRLQHRYSPIIDAPRRGARIDWVRIGLVGLILLASVVTTVAAKVAWPSGLEAAPLLGLTVWLAILLAVPLRRPDWAVLPAAVPGAVFLVALVTAASMMPVEALPPASWPTSLGLGLVSAVFDNVPLTALALRQGGYDWGFLAFAVGFGGSLTWFGSSAGVAIANLYPDAKSVVRWARHGWLIAVAYLVGFGAMLGLLGWHPAPPPRPPAGLLPDRSGALILPSTRAQ